MRLLFKDPTRSKKIRDSQHCTLESPCLYMNSRGLLLSAFGMHNNLGGWLARQWWTEIPQATTATTRYELGVGLRPGDMVMSCIPIFSRLGAFSTSKAITPKICYDRPVVHDAGTTTVAHPERESTLGPKFSSVIRAISTTHE